MIINVLICEDVYHIAWVNWSLDQRNAVQNLIHFISFKWMLNSLNESSLKRPHWPHSRNIHNNLHFVLHFIIYLFKNNLCLLEHLMGKTINYKFTLAFYCFKFKVMILPSFLSFLLKLRKCPCLFTILPQE